MKKKYIFLLLGGLLFVNNSMLSAQSLEEALAESSGWNYAEAVKILEAAAYDESTRKYLALGYLRAGNYNSAIDMFKLLPHTDYEICVGHGIAYLLNNDYQNAAMQFKAVMGANKNCAAGEYLQGVVLHAQGELQPALACYQRALKLDYNCTEARERMAELYIQLQQYNEAFREWSRIADIDPAYTTAQKNKEKLAALITKKPEEIIPPARIIEPSTVIPAGLSENIPLLRIGIFDDIKEVTIWARGGLAVYSGRNKIFETTDDEYFVLYASSPFITNGQKITLRTKQAERGLIIHNVAYASGFSWAGASDREYRGEVELSLKPKGILCVNVVNLEEYLYSVLPSEMIASWPDEALKTQAVITRTFALYRKNIARPHFKNGFDLCSSQHCQVYKGVKQETANARKITDQTRGLVLKCRGKLIHTLYSSNCSGHTQASKDLKGWGDEPYLSGVLDGDGSFASTMLEYEKWIKYPPDIYCAPSKYTYYAESRWMRVIFQEELSRRLNRKYKIGLTKKIVVLKRSPSGHIQQLEVTGTKGSVIIEKENLIRSIALGKIRSTNFIVEGYGNTQEDVPAFFLFWGAGWGHGVGLCQSGAAGMASRGFTFEQILKKYYKDSEIEKIDY